MAPTPEQGRKAGRKGRKRSPWSRGPMVNTDKNRARYPRTNDWENEA